MPLGQETTLGTLIPPSNKVALVPAVRPGASSPAKGSLLHGMSVVGLENENGVLAQAFLIQVLDHPPDQFVRGRHESRVLVAGVREVLVFDPPLVGRLERIVRPVDGPVDEERLGLVPRDEALALVHHHVPEVFPVPPDLLALLPEVVPVGSDPVEKMGIVVDASAHMAEGIVEPLTVGHGLGGIAQVPLPNVPGGIAVGLHELGDGRFGGRHAGRSLGGGDVPRNPRPGGDATGQQAGPGSRADGGRRIHVRKADARLGQVVDRRGVQILGTVAASVDAALVVGVDQNDVGLGREQDEGQTERDEELRVSHGRKLKVAGSVGQRKRGPAGRISGGVFEDPLEGAVEDRVGFLDLFGFLKEILRSHREKLLVPHCGIGVEVGLPVLDLPDLALDQLEPGKNVLAAHEQLGNTVHPAIHLVDQMNELVDGGVVPITLLLEPAVKGIPAKKHLSLRFPFPKQADDAAFLVVTGKTAVEGGAEDHDLVQSAVTPVVETEDGNDGVGPHARRRPR